MKSVPAHGGQLSYSNGAVVLFLGIPQEYL